MVKTMMLVIQEARRSAAMRSPMDSGLADRGAKTGRRRTTILIVMTKRKIRRSPGSTPALNNCPIDSSVRMA